MATAKSRGKAYTSDQLDFLREQYQNLTQTELHKAFNQRYQYAQRSYSAIRSAIRNHGMKCGGQGGKDTWQCTLMTRKQSDWLGENYVDISVREITDLFNKRYGKDLDIEQMKTFLGNRGFKSGRTGCYEKGSVPANKGLRRPGWSTGRMAETQFKPGHNQTEVMPIGHERIDKDGYILIKVDMLNPHTGAQGYYQFKHRVIWEAANGLIPKYHVLTFIDDDRNNCVLDNLELISRSELCRRNKMQYMQADPEARPTIKTIAKLQMTTALRQRKESKC